MEDIAVKNKKYIGILLILGMLLSTTISHIPVIFSLLYHRLSETPPAVNAVLSLSCKSDNNRIIMDGEWEFYWKHLLITDNDSVTEPDFYIRVPDYWSKYCLSGTYLPPDGYASYRLIINGLMLDDTITVYIPDFGSAYKVFIDGKLTAESGIVSKNTSDIFTTTKVNLYPVKLSQSQEHEVVVEVATTRFSGLYMAPVLTSYERAVNNKNVRNTIRFLLFGIAVHSFFILVLGYIISYRLEKRSFLLPVMGLLVIFRIMLTTEFYSFWQNTIFFGSSYEAVNPVMFLVSFAFKYMLIFLIERLIGIMFSAKEKTGLLIYYTVLYFIYLFIPKGFYNRHLTILLPVCAFLMEFYAFFKIYHNRSKIKKYGMAIYFSTIVAIIGLIIDCYYINGNIYWNMSLALLITFTVYLIILSLISSIQAANMTRDYALSSARLMSTREQIAMQSEYYNALSAQINEIRAIRHDFRHFVGVLQSLVNDGRYAELKNFLNEYTKRTDMEPLPIFCENVVANSILGYYSLRLKENNISFQFTCVIPEKFPVADSDLCVILGNGLENAMEACIKMNSEETRYINVEAREVNQQFLIKITNTFNGIIKQEKDRFISTKETPYHGIGLQNIKRVVAEYRGYIKTDYNQSLFTLMVAFPK